MQSISNNQRIPLSQLGYHLAKSLQTDQPTLIITYNAHHHALLIEQLQYFLENPELIAQLPDWEILPYDHFSPNKDIISQRLSLFAKWRQGTLPLCIIPCYVAMQKVPPAQYIDAHTFALKQGDVLSIDRFRETLSAKNYQCVATVKQHGEYAVRGAIIDLFPMGHHTPYRIELFDDTIDTVRSFDPKTQCSTKQVNNITCLPGHEYALDEKSIARFRENWRDHMPENWRDNNAYQSISDGKPFRGVEQYLPFFFEHALESIFDLLPKNAAIIHLAPEIKAAENFTALVNKRYEQALFQKQLPPLPVSSMYLDYEALHNDCEPFSQSSIELTKHSPLTMTIEPTSKQPLATFLEWLKKHPDTHVHFAINTTSRKQYLCDLLRSAKLDWQESDHWHTANTTGHTISISSGPLTHGFATENCSVITEESLFQSVMQQGNKKTATTSKHPALVAQPSAPSFQPDYPIVHEEHGVGRYLGLETIEVDHIAQEFLTIAYAEKDKLYVPVSQMHLLSRYAGADPEQAPLDKLGSNLWEKRKAKAKRQIEDIAANLLAIYAKRSAAKGQAKTIDLIAYHSFQQSCPYTLTLDQQKAVDETLGDLQSQQPMDRLICGDVGFGKTEVAMHAAFITAYQQNQVILLVPTTLLSEQHAETFTERFADWPITIACLSRLKSQKSRSEVISAFNQGKIDILIGTHQVLTADLNTDKLGLLIIDEEHRFGVKQKETLKKLRVNVDLLSLTATPIPRTLHMSLSGLRELSLITTAPEKRLCIETSVHVYQKGIIIEGIERELLRGGQVYFLHNKVQTIERVAKELESWLPKSRIAIAHGQLAPSKLEAIMRHFYQHKIDILVCTTIIESGIDVANANTMIINQAHRFGLAQLHQCRGRVGRSHHQAYAYLLTPEDVILPPDAVRRLKAIQSLDYLGAGFNLASQDLEIRGAGELLGDQQSGQVEGIGLNLYAAMLDRAIKQLKHSGANETFEPQCKMDIRCHALIPTTYIHEPDLRLALYQQLQSLLDEQSIVAFKFELQDRFGKLPDEVITLLKVRKWQFWADTLNWSGIKSGRSSLIIDLGVKPKMRIDRLIKLIQSDPQHFQLKQQTKLHCRLKGDNLVEEVEITLQKLREMQ